MEAELARLRKEVACRRGVIGELRGALDVLAFKGTPLRARWALAAGFGTGLLVAIGGGVAVATFALGG